MTPGHLLINKVCYQTEKSPCVSYDPNILFSNPNNALLMLIDSSRTMDAKRNIVMGLTSILIVNRYY